MPFTKTSDLSIHYEIRGEGEPVLYISGTGSDLRVKPNVLDGPLSGSFKTVAYDQRGLGQTDKPPGPYQMAHYADDAAGLLDELGLKEAHVVGVSFGGMVALHFALRHPNRIKRLVLCCTSPGGLFPSYPFHELPDNLSAGERVRHLMGISDLRRGESWQADHPDLVQKIVDATELAAIAEHRTEAFRQGARLQLEARARHNVLDRLADIRMPVLVCGGKYDGIAPAENQLALMEALPDAQLEWFEGGHLFLVQDKSAWPAIISFLSP